MRPFVTAVPCFVRLCLLDTAMSPTETDEPIEMPFGTWTATGVVAR